MKSQSPRSMPPPSLPRDLVARARIAGETDELGTVEDPRTQAAVQFELAALHEFGLGDTRRAEAHLRRALQQRPRFWPALLALARLYADQDQPAALAAVWEALGRSSRVPGSGAMALSYAARLLYDRLAQKERAVALWNDALALDPSCIEAALLLEHHHRAVGEERLVQRVVAVHAAALSDTVLEAAWLTELASAEERAGQIDPALQRLTQACELDPRARPAAYAGERIARKHARHAPLVAALDALATREQGGAGRAVARLCEAGRVLALRLATRGNARLRYDRALALCADDRLALWERALLTAEIATAEAGQVSARAAAIADLRALIEQAEREDDALAAAARIRLAELLTADGEAESALAELMLAAAQAPDSAAASAALEDALLRAGRFAALRDQLLARGTAAASGAPSTRSTLGASRCSSSAPRAERSTLSAARVSSEAAPNHTCARSTLRRCSQATTRRRSKPANGCAQASSSRSSDRYCVSISIIACAMRTSPPGSGCSRAHCTSRRSPAGSVTPHGWPRRARATMPCSRRRSSRSPSTPRTTGARRPTCAARRARCCARARRAKRWRPRAKRCGARPTTPTRCR